MADPDNRSKPSCPEPKPPARDCRGHPFDLTSGDDDLGDATDEFSEAEESIACPECGAEVHADAEACHACGYWITEADRSAAWNAGSATGRIKAVGLWVLGVALLVWLIFRAS